MLAKLIVWAPNRLDAIARMRRAIGEYVITGIETTLMIGDFVMTHPAFIEGKFDTHFIQQYFTPEAMRAPILDEQEQALLGVAALEFFHREKAQNGSILDISSNGGAVTSDWYLNRKNYS